MRKCKIGLRFCRSITAFHRVIRFLDNLKRSPMEFTVEVATRCWLVNWQPVLPALKGEAAVVNAVDRKKDRHSIKEWIIQHIRVFGFTQDNRSGFVPQRNTVSATVEINYGRITSA